MIMNEAFDDALAGMKRAAMDANQALKKLRTLIASNEVAGDGSFSAEIARTFAELDLALGTGGTLPDEWATAPPPAELSDPDVLTWAAQAGRSLQSWQEQLLVDAAIVDGEWVLGKKVSSATVATLTEAGVIGEARQSGGDARYPLTMIGRALRMLVLQRGE